MSSRKDCDMNNGKTEGIMEKTELTARLEQARQYERQHQTAAQERPAFHVTAPVGWINDPNGFSLFQGEYHLFYQYHPYSSLWGPMHWGHCKTKDFIRWTWLPCALAPDEAYDGQGCFSGSAVEQDGKHLLMYTGVREREKEDGTKEVFQTQCMAVGDGTDYVKLQENPVILADSLPEGSSAADFRDPKIWREDGRFYAVIGSLDGDGSGQIALFSSADGTGWSFESILDRNQGRYGKMWECPDFFTLDSRQVLIVSPQFMRAEGLEFHNGNNSIYFVGSYEKEKKCFLRKEARQIDYGLDFYAPQTLETADGRRIMIAWMKSWDNDLTPEGAGWSGMMTVPRELRLDGERLIQNPVRELETYRRNEVRHAVRLTREDGEKALDGISGRVLDMTVELKAGDYEVFQIALAADSDSRTLLVYDRKRATLTTDRTWSGLRKDQVCVRSAAVREREGKLKLRIVMDRFSAEVFVNDGETAMSTVIHTDQKAQGIFFSCDGTAEISVVKYDLEAEGLTF